MFKTSAKDIAYRVAELIVAEIAVVSITVPISVYLTQNQHSSYWLIPTFASPIALVVIWWFLRAIYKWFERREGGRTYVYRSFSEVFSEIADNKMRAAKTYTGKWLKIDYLSITGITAVTFDGSIEVQVGIPDMDYKHISLYFEKRRWEGEIETLKVNDRIKSVGKISGMGDSWIDLRLCEINDVKSEPIKEKAPS